MRDSSVSAQTFETFGETVVNPIDFEEVADVNVAKSIEADPYSHMPCFGDFNRKSPEDANLVNLTDGVKRATSRKLVLMFVIYCICATNRLMN